MEPSLKHVLLLLASPSLEELVMDLALPILLKISQIAIILIRSGNSFLTFFQLQAQSRYVSLFNYVIGTHIDIHF